ncbi:MAG: MG2 domain-containing protein, partial [Planctomycetota bacterium]|nr:MG2 domain-containing protein [Planctomycetota bacterium]
MLLHRKRPALVLSRILICILAGCTVWSCGAGTPQTDTQRLTALADDIVPAREPVRPPYELARYDLSLKECGSLEALTAQAIKRQKELETHWSALRSVEVGANAPLRAQQALLAYAFGEKTLDEIRAAVSAAGSQERLRLARLLLAECRFDEAVEELIALVREGTSDGDFALAVLARHHVEREELEKRASLVPLRHDLKTFMAECEKTPRYDGWLPVLRQSVLPRLPPKEPLEIAATEVVIPSDPDDWEPNSDLVLIRDFQNPRSELCNASLHSGSLSTAYLQTATNDLFLYREGKAAVFARRGLVAFKLHTRYHGPITFRLYSFPSRDEWNRVSAAVLATLKPERQWSETFTPLSSNNVAGVKTETVQVKELAPGHYLLTAEARYAPVLAGHPFVVSGASLYLRVASNQIVVAAVSRDEGKPLANTPVKVQVHSAMPGVAPETAEERADAPAFLYGLRGQPLPAQQNATPEQRAVAEKAHAAGMARYRAAPDTDMVMQGMSDENGLCTFNVDLKNTVHVHHVTAQLGTGDPVCATASYLHPREPEDHIKAVAWFAQPIYRPGNTAQFKGVVRRFNGLRVAPHDPRWKTAVHVQVKNTKAILWEGRCDTTSAGGFSGEFTIPSTAALGGYDLFVEGTSASPQGALRVEEFRIPTFRVLVTPGRYICHPGQDIA